MNSSNSNPLLLLDNSTLAYILGNGEFRFANLKFEEAKAILDMNVGCEVIRCFDNTDVEQIIFEHLGIDKQDFTYVPTQKMEIGQDAIVFKLYITPSGTQPIILGEDGVQAKKVKNVYIYCQHVIRLK